MRVNEEDFYEVEVEVVQRRATTVVLHLRAGSHEEARRRAVQKVHEACDNAVSEYDLPVDGSDFDFMDYEVGGVENVALIGHGEEPQWDYPTFDLMDSPTDAEAAGDQTDPRQQPLPFP